MFDFGEFYTFAKKDRRGGGAREIKCDEIGSTN